MEHDYVLKDLRKQFSLDESLSDFILSPLLDVAFRAFYNKLKENPETVGATDAKFTDLNSATLVINGKIVYLGCRRSFDIDVYDDDSSWYMIDKVLCSGDDTEEANLLQKFVDFVVAIPYQQLHDMAVKSLGEDRRRLHFKMSDFYFPSQ
jgi:hypothetical protein